MAAKKKNILQVICEDGRYNSYYNGTRLTSSARVNHAEIILAEGTNSKMKKYKLTSKNTDVDYIDCTPTDMAAQVSGHSVPDVTVKSYDFGINERFEIMEQLVRLITNSAIPSLMITGDGGLGKTHTVMDVINQANLKNCDDYTAYNTDLIESYIAPKKKKKDDDDDEADADFSETETNGMIPAITKRGDYNVIKGYSSPRGLYETLYLNHDKINIFDDCDSILRDANALNILKGALDSYDERIITWNITLGRSVGAIKNRFEFTGKIIFISNMHKESLDNAVRSRCQNVDVSMTRVEKVERMEYILPNMNQFDKSVRKAALKFIKQNLDYIPDRNLNLRTLISIAKLAQNAGDEDWNRIAQYTVQE